MRIGITTTVPVEILFAAGKSPVDLNNIFVADPDAAQLVDTAEREGFPASTCAWTKGLYATIHKHGIEEVVGVVEGDCSDTGALLDILRSEGVSVHPFAYPHTRDADDLTREMTRLAARLGTSLPEAETLKRELDAVRGLAREIDTLAHTRGCVTGDELSAHLLLLSDFGGDPMQAEATLRKALDEIRARPEAEPAFRLGCIGVPTILSDLWQRFEERGARFVYHEVPAQFALLDGIGADLATAYTEYTYPYDAAHRLGRIVAEAQTRRLDGLIHYVQSFCHRQILDRLLRESADLPILTVEADRPGPVDARTRTRIEAFLEQLGA